MRKATEYSDLLAALTPEVYARFRQAVELGKWPDGRVLTEQQKTSCMDAIIAYDARHLSPEARTGYIDRGRKAPTDVCDEPQALILPE